MSTSRCRLLLALGLASTTAVTMVVLALGAPAAVAAPAPAPATGISEQAACAAVGPLQPGVARCFAIARTPTVAKPMAGGRTIATPQSSSTPLAGSTTPDQVQTLYGVKGRTAATGTTVAIVTAYDAPNLESDLAQFRQYFGLSACTTANGCFRKVNQTGQLISSGAPAPTANTGWAVESSLDTQAVSSTCPNCHILVVEANSSYISDLGAAVNAAVQLGAKIVSNSYGSPEFTGQASVDSQYYTHPGVALMAASGDNGWLNYGSPTPSDRGLANYPATSANVLAVGGTTLTRSSSGALTEQAWSDGGSGCSIVTPRPQWQSAYFTANNISPDPQCTLPSNGAPARAEVDVSALADPNMGLAVYVAGGWQQVGGTSLSAPLMAGIQALAGPPQSGDVAAAYPYQRGGAGLTDITSGSNQTSTDTCGGTPICAAGVSWDGPTGLGSTYGLNAFAPSVLSTSPSATVAGSSVSVAGSNFGTAPVSITTSTSSSAVSVTPANGAFSTSVTVAPTFPGGTFTVTATQGSSTPVTSTVMVATPQLLATPSATAPATAVTLSGSGWAAAQQVSFAVMDASSAVPGPAPVTANQDGTLPPGVSFTLPARLSGSNTGAWSVQVQATSANGSATTPVAIPAATISVPGAAAPGATIPITGANFAAGESVAVSGGSTTVQLTASGSGGFPSNAAVTLPLTASASATLTATGANSGRTASATVYLPAASLTIAGNIPSGGTATVTGMNFGAGQTVNLSSTNSQVSMPRTTTADARGIVQFVVSAPATSCQTPVTISGVDSTGRPAAQATTVIGSKSVLPAGCSLAAGQSLSSPSGQYVLVMQGDGNLVLYGNGRAMWFSGTTGSNATLVMQGDGNAVLYVSTGPVFATMTFGSNAVLALQDDGNLVLYTSSGPAWFTGGGGTDRLAAPAQLLPGWTLHSAGGGYTLVMQGDGNLVVYGPSGAIWSSGTSGASSALLALQGDGNLVIYAPGGPRWWTATAGSGNQLVMQRDGNLVLYSSAGQPLWSSYGFPV